MNAAFVALHRILLSGKYVKFSLDVILIHVQATVSHRNKTLVSDIPSN